MGPHHQTFGNLHSRLHGRRATKVSASNPNHTVYLSSSIYITQLWFHSAPTGAPHWLPPITKSRRSQQCTSGSRENYVLFTQSRPGHASRPKKQSRLSGKIKSGNSKKYGVTYQPVGHQPGGNHPLTNQRHYCTHAQQRVFYHCSRSQYQSGGISLSECTFGKPKPPTPHIPHRLKAPIHVECTTMKNFLTSAMKS